MAICTKTGLVFNNEDIKRYDVDEAVKVMADVPVGKARKPDGTLIDLPVKP